MCMYNSKICTTKIGLQHVPIPLGLPIPCLLIRCRLPLEVTDIPLADHWRPMFNLLDISSRATIRVDLFSRIVLASLLLQIHSVDHVSQAKK